MCVILVAKEKKLSGSMIRKANAANPHGLGIAWLEGNEVRYKKGLTLTELLSLNKRVSLPYIVHARIKTEGRECGEMCHPFPITRRDNRKLSGAAKAVLFHNGHWSEWLETTKRISKRWGKEMPGGDMSDSRAMAWCVAMGGSSILDTNHGQKYAVLSTEGVQLYGSGWAVWNGYDVSNLNWVGRDMRFVAEQPNYKTTKNWASAAIPELGEDYEWVEEFGEMMEESQAPKHEPGWYVVPRESDDEFSATELVLAKTTEEAEQLLSGNRDGGVVEQAKKQRKAKIKASNGQKRQKRRKSKSSKKIKKSLKAKMKVTDRRRIKGLEDAMVQSSLQPGPKPKPKTQSFDEWIKDWRASKMNPWRWERRPE
jgi:hypothetical protein